MLASSPKISRLRWKFESILRMKSLSSYLSSLYTILMRDGVGGYHGGNGSE
jgi:hypothetical protein